MKISELSIFRVREIEQLRLNFGDKQLVAILGENGSGKTTLLACIVWLFSGEIILKGAKERMIRDTGSGDSWVSGVASHGDKQFRIKRFLSSSTCELVYLNVANGKPIKGAVKVQAELDAMGLTKDRVLRTLMEQGKYGTLFHATDGDRLRSMFEIFGLRDCDEIQRAVAAEASLIPVDLTIDERWETAKKTKDEADAAVATALTAKTIVDARYRSYAEARKVLAAAAEFESRLTQRARLQGTAEALAKGIAESTAQLNVAIAEMGTITGAKEVIVTELAAAKSVVDAATTYEAMAKSLPAIIAEIKTRNADIAQLEAELKTCGAVDDAAIAAMRAEYEAITADVGSAKLFATKFETIAKSQAALAERRDAVARMKLRVDKFPATLDDDLKAATEELRRLNEQVELGRSGICPACKQPLPDRHECMPLEQSEALRNEAEVRFRQLSENRIDRDGAARAHGAAVAVAAAAEAELGALQAEVAGVPEADVRNVIVAGGARAEAIRTALDVATRNATLVSQLTSTLAVRRSTLEQKNEYIAKVEAMRCDPQRVEQARATLALATELDAKARATSAMIASYTARVTATKAEHDKIEAQLATVNITGAISSADVDAAKAAVAAAGNIDDERNVTDSNHAAAEARAKLALQGFASIDALRRQNEANKRKHDLVNDIKFLTGVKQFPMFVAGFYVQAINALWAEELELVDAGFVAWQDATTLEFNVSFHGGDTTRLLYQASGGERQLAAVGYQVVINRLFAAGVDWIAFDEPSTHVDANYRPKLVHAFTRMAGRPDFKDTQIFIVDHSVEFTTAISDPIVLHKNS